MRQRRNRFGTALLMSVAGAVLILACSGHRSSDVTLGSGGAGADAGGSSVAGSGGAAGSMPDDASGTGLPVGPTFIDGTRLVAQTYLVPGTEPLFVGVFDRQENVACAFRIAS